MQYVRVCVQYTHNISLISFYLVINGGEEEKRGREEERRAEDEWYVHMLSEREKVEIEGIE